MYVEDSGRSMTQMPDKEESQKDQKNQKANKKLT